MKIFRFYKFFSIENYETINSSIVLIDNNTNILSDATQQPTQINNPFTELANKTKLNNAYNTIFEEQNINNNIKNFTSENYDVVYNLFPARFQIIQERER